MCIVNCYYSKYCMKTKIMLKFIMNFGKELFIIFSFYFRMKSPNINDIISIFPFEEKMQTICNVY